MTWTLQVGGRRSREDRTHEPTGSLDYDNGRRVLELLHDLVVDEQRKLLLVTHSLEVARSADDVYVLEGGALESYQDGIAW